ncbi:hypothetical protein O9993_17350 [Vibrio lentus]|nr:hypothetical protein [Vibrio lentus]
MGSIPSSSSDDKLKVLEDFFVWKSIGLLSSLIVIIAIIAGLFYKDYVSGDWPQ